MKSIFVLCFLLAMILVAQAAKSRHYYSDEEEREERGLRKGYEPEEEMEEEKNWPRRQKEREEPKEEKPRDQGILKCPNLSKCPQAKHQFEKALIELKGSSGTVCVYDKANYVTCNLTPSHSFCRIGKEKIRIDCSHPYSENCKLYC